MRCRHSVDEDEDDDDVLVVAAPSIAAPLAANAAVTPTAMSVLRQRAAAPASERYCATSAEGGTA